MNRNYELMFIVRPDMVDEDLNKLISTLESSVTSAGGTAKSGGLGQAPSRLQGREVQRRHFCAAHDRGHRSDDPRS